jgi:hypothetical protein
LRKEPWQQGALYVQLARRITAATVMATVWPWSRESWKGSLMIRNPPLTGQVLRL